MRRSESTAILPVLVAVVLWNTSFGTIKIGLAGFPPVSFAALRFAFASAFIQILRFDGPRFPGSSGAFALDPVPRADLARMALGGLFGIMIVLTLQRALVCATPHRRTPNLLIAYPVIIILAELLPRTRHLGGALRRFTVTALAIAGIYLVISAVGQVSPGAAAGTTGEAAAAAGIWLLGNLHDS